MQVESSISVMHLSIDTRIFGRVVDALYVAVQAVAVGSVIQLLRGVTSVKVAVSTFGSVVDAA